MAKKKNKKPDSDINNEAAKLEKKSSIPISQFILAITLGVTSFGTVFMLPGDATKSVPNETENAHNKKEDIVGLPLLETAFVPLTDMTLSLHENSKILKIGITLETTLDGENIVNPDNPKLRDAFMGYLRSLRVEQLEDAAFMVQMRSQLLRRAKLILGSETVQGVLITDFLVR